MVHPVTVTPIMLCEVVRNSDAIVSPGKTFLQLFITTLYLAIVSTLINVLNTLLVKAVNISSNVFCGVSLYNNARQFILFLAYNSTCCQCPNTIIASSFVLK